jgi:NAD(P)-dependent dehydrogenase (short-subunit alcohol dehydrogenase family)
VQKLAALMSEGSAAIFTTSVANVKGFPIFSAYSASKAELRSMTRGLCRAEFERRYHEPIAA